MLKNKTFITFFCLILSTILILSGCTSKDSRTTVFETEFENGNQEIFTSYGQVVKKEEGIALVKGEENIGPITYFGNNESKNTYFSNRGLAVELTMETEEDLVLGDSFDWNFVLNNKEKNPMAKVVVSFKKYLDGIRVGFSHSTGEEANEKATAISNENSKILTANKFILEVSFYSNIEDEILFTILIKDKDKKEIYKSEGNSLVNEAGEKIGTKEVFGLRSCGLSYMTISKVYVKKVRVLEN